MKTQRQLPMLLFLVCIISLFPTGKSYSCSGTALNNWLWGWPACYQATDGNVLGSVQSTLTPNTNCLGGVCAVWDYNYATNIAFVIAPYSVNTQYWNYTYHTIDICCQTTCVCTSPNVYDLQLQQNFAGTVCTNYKNRMGQWRCWTYDYQTDYYANNQNTPIVYLPCHYYCASCTTTWSNTTCQSCSNKTVNAYQWLAWGSSTIYINTCDTKCPNDADRGYDNLYPGQYIESTASRLCALCNTSCSVCANFSASNCSVCVSSSALIMNYDLCLASFSSADNVNCKANNQCVNSCPSLLYFWLSKSQTANTIYPFTSLNPSLQLSNICYLCHKYCLQCTNQYDNNCSSCSLGYYLWQQYPNRCNYYCKEGVYSTGGALGEYVISTAGRLCGLCAAGCQFCASSANKCYICQDDRFLVDDRQVCISTFNCPLCTNTTYTTDGCASANNYCRANACPSFFYYKVNRTGTGASDGSQNNLYLAFTLATSINTSINGYELGTSRSDNSSLKSDQNKIFYYRQATNFCKLCDFRCMKCFGPSNMECTQCVNFFYKWTNATVCSSTCPQGQFQMTISASYPDNQTKCDSCNYLCISCSGFSTNCSSCYTYPLANYSFLHYYSPSNSTCLLSCPKSSSPLTQKGYYDNINTMICTLCPDQCSNCHIIIAMDPVNQPLVQLISCQLDITCSKGIICTSCLSGYALASGKCVTDNTCREYSYYNQVNSSSGWSSTNCICLKGFYLSSLMACSTCHISCLTCNGPSSSNCLSCLEGYSLSIGYTCNSANTGSLIVQQTIWTSSQVFDSHLSSNLANQKKYCGSYYTLFGYKSSLTKSNIFTYTTGAISSNNYYGIGFKLRVLFIDQWDSNAGLQFFLNSDTNPSFSYSYTTYNAIGQQKCGTNAYDYLLTIDGIISLSPLQNQINTITIKSNIDAVQNSSGFYYYWGIQSAQFYVLKCHSDCDSCTGPSSNQCTSCSDNMKTLITDGTCRCNTAFNYFYIVGSTTACQTGCPTSFCDSTTNPSLCYYRDYPTATCVTPPIKNCTAPFNLGNSVNLANTYGTCVQYCSLGMYAVLSIMKCTTSCSIFGLYNYQGASTGSISMWTCVSKCPIGWIADPSTSSCVSICPQNYYYQLQNRTTNPLCVSNCPSGYEYNPSRQCVTSCPSGYYIQVQGTHNKCVQVCSTGKYGDNSTLTCVDFCPSPSIADSITSICVNACPDGYAFQICKINGSRQCVSACQSGQWMNKYTMTCSQNPMDCSSGTYADNSTNTCENSCKNIGQVGESTNRMCQTYCNTGYAYWQIGLCVPICNNSMFGLVFNNTRQCVASCNSQATSMFGDIQANRTCVSVCSSSPVSTFGDTSTGLCQQKCSQSNKYGDPYHPQRLCTLKCTNNPVITYSYIITKVCVSNCPNGYYGDSVTLSGFGVCTTVCPINYYRDPVLNLCVLKCSDGYFGGPLPLKDCLKVCPYGYYSINSTTNRICTSYCDSGYWADNYTRTCVSSKFLCSNNTYADSLKRICVQQTNCTKGTYADPITNGCQTICTNTSFAADPSTNRCVFTCPKTPDTYQQNSICTSLCLNNQYADYQNNRICSALCSDSPTSLYGNSIFRCVKASQCGLGLFGDNTTRTCTDCKVNSSLPFGDSFYNQCVRYCSSSYFGDYNINLCVPNCNISNNQYADSISHTCTKLCSPGTYGIYDLVNPICGPYCPENYYALQVGRICVPNCGVGLFDDSLTGKCFQDPRNCSEGYYGNSITNKCVQPAYCQVVNGYHYYADYLTKRCLPKCSSPSYGDNITWTCLPRCPWPLYGQNNTRMCLIQSQCKVYGSYSDQQLNLCVSRCSSQPIPIYSQNINYFCVVPKDCTPGLIGQNLTQSCSIGCPYNNTYKTYADTYSSKICVFKCPDMFYGYNINNYGYCLSNCPGDYLFRDNFTQLCVLSCTAADPILGSFDTYGDPKVDMCVTYCPEGYFAQIQLNRICVTKCMDGTWGNQVTRMCINNPVNNCPWGTWADNFTNLCTNICSENSSNSQIYYGENTTKLCLPSCPVPTFAYIPTKVCIDICPNTLDTFSGLFGDPSTLPTRLCVPNCLTTGLYRDIANNRTCQSTCIYNSSYKTYKDPTSMSCVAQCPTYPQQLYAWASNNYNSQCVSICPTGYMYDGNMSCIDQCPYLLDPTINKCVSQCPYNTLANDMLYADLSSKTCVLAELCPIDTYASDQLLMCVANCPNGTYIYQKYCIHYCPNGLYANDILQTCVTPQNCPSNTFGNPGSGKCDYRCTNGYFGDSTSNMCLINCPNYTYANSITITCQQNCSYGLINVIATLKCIGNCIQGSYFDPFSNSCVNKCSSPYFADQIQRSCVLICSGNPIKYGLNGLQRICNDICPNQTKWADLEKRICVSNCSGNTYSYSLTMQCLSICPPPYYGFNNTCIKDCSSILTLDYYADEQTRMCTTICSSGYYKDPTTFRCVLQCPSNPIPYYSLIQEFSRVCVTKCSNDTFADDQTHSCVTQCPKTPIKYGQPNSRKCVSSCPSSYASFSDITTQKCVQTCPNGYYTDIRQRMCLKSCGIIYFADSLTSPPSCVATCSPGTYADYLSYSCTTKCSGSYYGFSQNNTCLQFCPFGFFADSISGFCVQQCRNYPLIYADSLTHLCQSSCSNNQYAYKTTNSSYGFCVFTCPNNSFSNPLSSTCDIKCPNGYFGSTINNTCNKQCSQDMYKDSSNNLCQNICPEANNLFGQPFSKSCVLNCGININVVLFADYNTRNCVTVCSNELFGDILTRTCVNIDSCSGGYFSDPFSKKCVQKCSPQTYSLSGRCMLACPSDLFADEETQSCVSATGCSIGLYGDPSKGKCVSQCDISSARYADDSTKICMLGCGSPFYADNITRSCVKSCTSIPQFYGQNKTQMCVERCPPLSFGDSLLNICVSQCSDIYFGDQNTWLCLRQCPVGKFGDITTNKCVDTCSTPYFGDGLKNICVLKCEDGQFSDQFSNRQCVNTCSNFLFAQNSTNQCLQNCLTGFSNPLSQQCQVTCPNGYYGYKYICYQQQCPLLNALLKQVFADDSTNLCVQQCPLGTYGQLTSRKCIQTCPVQLNNFADPTTKTCVTICPNTYFADFSTRKCVKTCPSVPSLFGQNGICLQQCRGGLFADKKSRLCFQTCNEGTYSNNITYQCVTSCSNSPKMYSDDISNTCVYYCSDVYDRFADYDSGKCVIKCPNGSYGDFITRKCITTCPIGYFGVQQSNRCESICISPYFANNFTRKCELKCHTDPISFGDPISHMCISICPSNSFGNIINQQCTYDSGAISTCPNGYYGDYISQICVINCPRQYFLFANPLNKKCSPTCPLEYYYDRSNMQCVDRCPNYPSLFGNNSTKNCVSQCPFETFADESTRFCELNCSNQTYADRSTWRCVKSCPKNASSLKDKTTNRCVSICPEGYYADYQHFLCVSICPSVSNSFGRNDTRQCTKICPQNSFAYFPTRICVSQCFNSTFKYNQQRQCTIKCPRSPSLYSDNSTYSCVSFCPQGTFSYDDTRQCLFKCPVSYYYRQNSTRSCVMACDIADGTFTDNFTGYCVDRCTQGTYSDRTTMRCVIKCPSVPQMYAFKGTQSCESVCPDGFFGQNKTRLCVTQCPPASYSYTISKLCLFQCPQGMFADDQTNYCVQSCSSPYFTDPSTRRCVLNCPSGQLFYSDYLSRSCVKKCPSGTYSDQTTFTCLSNCPIAFPPYIQTYSLSLDNTCVIQCPYSFYALDINYQCVNYCPNLYYANLENHRCQLCPKSCLSCLSYQKCTSCLLGYYILNGKCLLKCPNIYYSNPLNKKCVVSSYCNPYYGVNSTNSCEKDCPFGTFINKLIFRCDTCPSTCISCQSSTKCNTCIKQSVFIDNFCHGFCNSTNQTFRYYSPDNKTCLDSCKNGTFNVSIYCKLCEGNCSTCQGESLNCTSCKGGYYIYNNTCLTECPKLYKPNSKRKCIFCNDTCGLRLRYKVNATNIDGNVILFMNFNRQIITIGNLYRILTVRGKQKRLLQGYTSLPYNIEIIGPQTIKISFSEGVVYPIFQLMIHNPQNIFDISGNLPDFIYTIVEVNISQYYSTSISNAPSNFSTYFAFLSIFATITLFVDTQFVKFLQIIYIHYFINISLSSQFTKAFNNLRLSTFYYLPSIFSYQKSQLRSEVPSSIYNSVGDYNFIENSGFCFTIFLILLLIWAIIKILTISQINPYKRVRLWCTAFLKNHFRYAIFLQCTSLLLVSTVFFSFLQLRNYILYDSLTQLSLVASHLIIIIFTFITAYLFYKIIWFYNQFPKLSSRIKKASSLIVSYDEKQNLGSNVFLYDNKKIDLSNIQNPKINNQNILPFRCIYRFSFLSLLCPAVQFSRVIILSALISLSQNSFVQIGLAISMHFITFLYFIRARPFTQKIKKIKVKNYLALFHQLGILFFEVMLIILSILQKQSATTSQVQEFSIYILSYLSAICSISFLWQLTVTGLFIYKNWWLYFVSTQYFKKNFPLIYQKYQYQKLKQIKLIKGIDPKAKQQLKNLINGYKKAKIILRPTQKQKLNPILPTKNKITYFDKFGTKFSTQTTKINKNKKKEILNEIFDEKGWEQIQEEMKRQQDQFTQIRRDSCYEQTDFEYQQYEQQFTVDAKKLQNIVNNGNYLLKMKQLIQRNNK